MDLFESYYKKLEEDAKGYIVHLETESGFKFGRSVMANTEEEAKDIVSIEFPDATIIGISEPDKKGNEEIKRCDYQNI